MAAVVSSSIVPVVLRNDGNEDEHGEDLAVGSGAQHLEP